MVDYFTHFSCLLDVRTAANAARALEIYENGVLADDPLTVDDRGVDQVREVADQLEVAARGEACRTVSTSGRRSPCS